MLTNADTQTKKKKLTADFLLLVTTFFWGVTFVVVKEAIETVEVFVFLSQRFIAAAIIMTGICLVLRRPFKVAWISRGFVMGLFLFGGYAFQTLALLYTTASNTAFLTGLNVGLVELLGMPFYGLRINKNMILGVLLAALGLSLLSTGGGSLRPNQGDLLACICAVSIALHLIYTGKFAVTGGVYWLTAIQLGVVALLSMASSFFLGDRFLVIHPEIIWALVVTVLFATVFAFLVQTAMQRLTSPTHTALIFCMEPVFATIYASFALGERLGITGFLGGFLILAGMAVAETGSHVQPGH